MWFYLYELIFYCTFSSLGGGVFGRLLFADVMSLLYEVVPEVVELRQTLGLSFEPGQRQTVRDLEWDEREK